MYKKRVLVIGSGGREHALVWKIAQSPKVEKVFCAPGNPGIQSLAECVLLKIDDFACLEKFVKDNKIDLTVVGPEAPLASGIVDYFNEKGLKIFGPNRTAAKFESSKAFAKNFMRKYGIPTASFNNFKNYENALNFINNYTSENKLVVKADGLAAGKGVIICDNKSVAKEAINRIMKEKVFGDAGKEIVIEEFLDGEEASLQIFLDSKNYLLMLSAQDHKRANDGDKGPNTGGMGAYSPAPIIDEKTIKLIEKQIIKPFIKGLKEEGIDYRGVLYIGLMIVKGNPFVVEFNCRFGDPETQVVLPLMKSDIVEIMESTISATLDKQNLEWYNSTATCVVIASGGYPGDYKKGFEIKGLDTAQKIKDVMIFHAGTSYSSGKIVNSGGRVLGVTGIGKNISESVKKAYEGVSEISFEGMHFRKDIARRALIKS
ncbi:MAG: phosphoribosylamine--glycine ligase [Elusimicrobia bacterium]|nr:phosphoribosylamine--glycine ligase [Elusimicrobiota bacterium]